MEELYKTIDLCFGTKKRLSEDEFKRINEEIASDTLLSVLNLLREKLPCSENFWRYKRNYDLHRRENQAASTVARSNGSDMGMSGLTINTSIANSNYDVTPKKELASPRMSGIKALQ